MKNRAQPPQLVKNQSNHAKIAYQKSGISNFLPNNRAQPPFLATAWQFLPAVHDLVHIKSRKYRIFAQTVAYSGAHLPQYVISAQQE